MFGVGRTSKRNLQKSRTTHGKPQKITTLNNFTERLERWENSPLEEDYCIF
jgi:hypothetical protein